MSDPVVFCIPVCEPLCCILSTNTAHSESRQPRHQTLGGRTPVLIKEVWEEASEAYFLKHASSGDDIREVAANLLKRVALEERFCAIAVISRWNGIHVAPTVVMKAKTEVLALDSVFGPPPDYITPISFLTNLRGVIFEVDGVYNKIYASMDWFVKRKLHPVAASTTSFIARGRVLVGSF